MLAEKWKTEAFFWLSLLVILTPWLLFVSRLAANSDNLWLADCLDKILHGGMMSRDAYELNPPLTLFLFAPVIALARIGVPQADGITLLGLTAILLCILAIRHILSRWNFLGRRQVAVIAAGLAIAETIPGAGTSLAERDQLIGLALVPFFSDPVRAVAWSALAEAHRLDCVRSRSFPDYAQTALRPAAGAFHSAAAFSAASLFGFTRARCHLPCGRGDF